MKVRIESENMTEKFQAICTPLFLSPTSNIKNHFVFPANPLKYYEVFAEALFSLPLIFHENCSTGQSTQYIGNQNNNYLNIGGPNDNYHQWNDIINSVRIYKN